MRNYLMLLSVVIFVGFTSCNNATKTPSTSVNTSLKSKTHTTLKISGKVTDVIQTTSYTYCKMNVSGSEYWIAISKMPVDTGQVLYFNIGPEMRNFHSRELNRDFPLLYLVQDVSTIPDGKIMSSQQLEQAATKPDIVKKTVKIKPVKNGITIAKLYANKTAYAGKKIQVRGKVTKYNPRIMGRNFVHIQDGTENGNNFDLTVTTQNKVNVGDVVTFEGMITLNKDFGAGYFYPVIMEKAAVVK